MRFKKTEIKNEISAVGEALTAKYLEVTARDNESVESMIKRFTKKVRNDGVMEDYMDRRFYVKKSVKRRQKKANSIFKSKLK